MFKIQTVNNIAAKGLAKFPLDHYEIASDFLDPDAILVRSTSLHQSTFGQALQAVGRAGAGVNNIPIEELSARGIPVFNTPGANANAVKELTIAAMLVISRNLAPAWSFLQSTAPDTSSHQLEALIEAQKKSFAGSELAGKTLGVIGLGAIGVLVANTSISLGMRVIGYDPGITIKGAWSLKSKVQQASSIEEVMATADFLSLHVPLNENTKMLVNPDRLRSLKKNAVIINLARGAIVDEQAVAVALQEKKLRAYVTDFPTPTLLHHPQVLSLPHLGASTEEAEENCAVMIVEQIRDFLEHGNLNNSVNFPTVHSAPSEKFRLTIANANIPNMVGQFSGILAAGGLNILDMINKSKQNVAYTIIETDRPIKEEYLTQIRQISGVLKVRAFAPSR